MQEVLHHIHCEEEDKQYFLLICMPRLKHIKVVRWISAQYALCTMICVPELKQPDHRTWI